MAEGAHPEIIKKSNARKVRINSGNIKELKAILPRGSNHNRNPDGDKRTKDG